MKEHIRKNKSHKHIYQLLHLMSRGPKDRQSKITQTYQSLSELIIWERLFIQKYKLITMNFDISSEKNLI